MGHFVPSPMPSQRSMIESMIKPVGDRFWQRGTNCGGVSCPGGQVAVLQEVRGTKYGCCNWSERTDFGGTGCSMTGPPW